MVGRMSFARVVVLEKSAVVKKHVLPDGPPARSAVTS